jgi:hypothetical protein
MNRFAVEQAAAFALPLAVPVPGDDTREQRNWAVRFSEELPPGWNSERVGSIANRAAEVAVEHACVERGIHDLDARAHRPAVRLVAVDERHVLVNVTTLRVAADRADTCLVAAGAALRALEAEAAIADLQGIPRSAWRLLLGDPSGARG